MRELNAPVKLLETLGELLYIDLRVTAAESLDILLILYLALVISLWNFPYNSLNKRKRN